MENHYRTNRAFTLIELLTVIAIIGILAALLFPALKKSLQKAEIARAATAVAGLETAFKAYYTEYGTWLVNVSNLALSNQTYAVDSNLVAVLQGMNNTGSLTGPSEPPFGPPYNPIGASALQGNARGIHFNDFKKADLDSLGRSVDPWGRPYYCRFDVSYANQVANPFTGAGTPNLNEGFIVWSAGPDGQYDNTGDTPPSALNKDNVKSW